MQVRVSGSIFHRRAIRRNPESEKIRSADALAPLTLPIRRHSRDRILNSFLFNAQNKEGSLFQAFSSADICELEEVPQPQGGEQSVSSRSRRY